MLIERGPRPPRVLVPLQRTQIPVEARLDRIGRDAQLVRCMAVVSDEFGRRCRGDGAGGLEPSNLYDDQGFHFGVGEGGGSSEFQVFEARD